jgi:hypothetical protein|tara:strand:- start:147 stop:713 length:567 start_codon:yes stop_codon:yes gene_type:complete
MTTRNFYARRNAARTTAPLADVLAFHEANPILAELAPHMDEYGENEFLRDLLRKCVQYGSLSAAQLTAARNTIDRDIQFRAERAADAADAADVPTGRIEIIGEVMSIKDKGWGPKMIVKHADGWKVWGSVPTSLTITWTAYMGDTRSADLDVAVGDIVRLTATVSASDNDPKFGFFKRPAKAQVVRAD